MCRFPLRPLPPELQTPIPTAPVGRLRVAVRAQELEVLEPVVLADAVLVVELHANWLSTPLGEPAPLASVLLKPGPDKAGLQMLPARLGAVSYEQLIEGDEMRPGHDLARIDRLKPGRPVEAESTPAFAHG